MSSFHICFEFKNGKQPVICKAHIAYACATKVLLSHREDNYESVG